MGDGRPDMVNRDPNNLNQSLMVQFEDIFGEPEGAHSIDCAWKCAFKCYEGSLHLCYKILTILCAWFYAFCWGCTFAGITFHYIWILTPLNRIFLICCGLCQKYNQAYHDCYYAPLFNVCALCFSKIKVTQG